MIKEMQYIERQAQFESVHLYLCHSIMAELPEEIITMIKKRCAEMNEEASKAKNPKQNFHMWKL